MGGRDRKVSRNVKKKLLIDEEDVGIKMPKRTRSSPAEKEAGRKKHRPNCSKPPLLEPVIIPAHNTTTPNRCAIQPFAPVKVSLEHTEIHNREYGSLYRKSPIKFKEARFQRGKYDKQVHFNGLNLISVQKLEEQPLYRLRKFWPDKSQCVNLTYSNSDRKDTVKKRLVLMNSIPFSSPLGRFMHPRLPLDKWVPPDATHLHERVIAPYCNPLNQTSEVKFSSTRESSRTLNRGTQRTEDGCFLSRRRGVCRPFKFSTKVEEKLPPKPRYSRANDPKLQPGAAAVHLIKLRLVYCEECCKYLLPEFEDINSHKCATSCSDIPRRDSESDSSLQYDGSHSSSSSREVHYNSSSLS